MIMTKLCAAGGLQRVKTLQQAVNFWAAGETALGERIQAAAGLIRTCPVPTNSQNESPGNEFLSAAIRYRTKSLKTGSNIYSLKEITTAASLGHSYATMSLMDEQMDMHTLARQMGTSIGMLEQY